MILSQGYRRGHVFTVGIALYDTNGSCRNTQEADDQDKDGRQDLDQGKASLFRRVIFWKFQINLRFPAGGKAVELENKTVAVR